MQDKQKVYKLYGSVKSNTRDIRINLNVNVYSTSLLTVLIVCDIYICVYVSFIIVAMLLIYISCMTNKRLNNFDVMYMRNRKIFFYQ